MFVVLFTAAGLKDVIHIRSRPYDDTTNDQLLRIATDGEISIINVQELERRNTSRDVTVVTRASLKLTLRRQSLDGDITVC